MTTVYDAPIGANPDGSMLPAGSVYDGLGSMTGAPLPPLSLTGGAAAPSAAGGGSIKNYIYNPSGGGISTVLFFAVIGGLGYLAWRKFK